MKRNIIIFFIELIASMVLLSCEMGFNTLRVVSCSPGNNMTGIDPESYLEIEFSAAVNRTDVEDNFSLENNEGSVRGIFTWLSPVRFRYIASETMNKNGRYVIELPRTIRDLDGNIMESDFISEFYVGNDFTPPVVVSSIPAYSTVAIEGITVNQNIVLNFSKSMNRESVEQEFSISPDVYGYFVWSENLPGVVNSRLAYTLTGNMEYGKLYTVKLSASAEDSSGNSLGENYVLNFITGNDFTPPVVVSMYDWTIPGAGWDISAPVHGISRNVVIGITFSKGMDRQSVEKAFSVTPSIAGVYEWSSDFICCFRPLEPLDSETKYQIAVETTAKDKNQLKMSSRYSVEIVTDNPDSLYVKCGTISGSNNNVDFTPIPDTWPGIIDMGSGTPVNREYYLLVEFISDELSSTAAEMDKYSIFDNVMIETFKGTTGEDELPCSAYIAYIEWLGDSSAKINIAGMTNRNSGQVPALYRLTIAGGENGVKDVRGNYMKDDFVIEFREAAL